MDFLLHWVFLEGLNYDRVLLVVRNEVPDHLAEDVTQFQGVDVGFWSPLQFCNWVAYTSYLELFSHQG